MSSRKPICQSCLFTVVLVLMGFSQICRAGQTGDYFLKQKHGFNGNQSLYIGKNMWRLDNPDLGYSLIAFGGSGKVSVFNLKKKLRFDSPLKTFSCQTTKLFRIAAGENLNAMKWQRAEKKEMTGTGKSTCFNAKEVRTYFRGSQSGGFLSGDKYHVEVRYRVWISDDIAVSRPLSRILADFQGTPDLGGIPLKEITEYSDRKEQKLNLETVELRRERFSDATWQVPVNCTFAKELADVISTTDKSELEDLIGD